VTIPAFGVWMVLIYDKLSGPLQYEWNNQTHVENVYEGSSTFPETEE
jgi:hypothetical protein